MSNRKLASIVEKLIEKTGRGELEWQVTERKDTYQVVLARFAVRIFSREGELGLDIVVQVFNQDGVIVEEASDPDMVGFLDEPFGRMSELLEDARRSAMGVDAALDALLRELTKDEPF